MKEIPLTQGKVALVDDEYYEELMEFKWYALMEGGTFYARRHSVTDEQGKRHTIRMHRFIMNTPDGLDTDHIDGDGLNNTRANLRVCTRAQNQRNKGAQRNNASGFKGVSFHRGAKKWRAQISIDGTKTYLGLFLTRELAYEAYCDASIKHHGDFAHF